eukprot:gene7234-9865_t
MSRANVNNYFLNWNLVVLKFERKFEHIFGVASNPKKAHFDMIPGVIDGARSRWCRLILLDGLLFLLNKNKVKFGSKRSFNQAAVLHDCMLESMLSNNASVSKNELDDFDVNIKELQFPWTSLANLKAHALLDTPSKSRSKFLKDIDLLTSHPIFQAFDFDFESIIKSVATDVLSTEMIHSRFTYTINDEISSVSSATRKKRRQDFNADDTSFLSIKKRNPNLHFDQHLSTKLSKVGTFSSWFQPDPDSYSVEDDEFSENIASDSSCDSDASSPIIYPEFFKVDESLNDSVDEDFVQNINTTVSISASDWQNVFDLFLQEE